MEEPYLLNIDLTKVKWQHSEPRLYVTTGAPQKLYRHLLDAIQTRGYHVIREKEPDITGTAIEKTGTIHGEILAEKMVKTIHRSWRQGGIIFGIIMIMLSFAIVVMAVFTSANFGYIAIFFILFMLGAMLMGIATEPKFESRLLYATLKGEVYYSAPGENVGVGMLSAESHRASMISDLGLGINLTTIFSANDYQPDNDPKALPQRMVLQYIYTEEAEEDFNGILTDINTNILPKLMLQKQEEAVAKPSAGVSLKELNDRLNQTNALFDKLDESLAHGEITEAKYKELTEKYRAEVDSLRDQIAEKKFM